MRRPIMSRPMIAPLTFAISKKRTLSDVCTPTSNFTIYCMDNIDRGAAHRRVCHYAPVRMT